MTINQENQNRKATRHGVPIPRMEHSRFGFALEFLAVIGVLFGIYQFATGYPQLPAQIPTHFNATGEPDRWGDKENLWLLVGGMILLYLFLTIVARFPHLYNYPLKITPENAARQFKLARGFIACLKTVVVWLFTWLMAETISMGLSKTTTMESELMMLFISLFVLVTAGYFLLAFRLR